MFSLIYLIKITLALLLSCFVGLEREHSDKEAGVRTIMLIALGTVVCTLLPFTLLELSKILIFSFDFSRIISYTIGGIGFLCGIVIITTRKKVEGVTTSACIWAVVSMSILVGLGEYITACIVAFYIWLILKSKYYAVIIKDRRQNGKKV